MNKDGVLRLSTVLFVSLCMPASVSAHTRPVRLCIALPAGGAAFAQIGQEELTISLIAKQKAAVFVVPVKLKEASSAAEAFDEARQRQCEYAVLTDISLKELATWSRPLKEIGPFVDAPYFRLQMEYKVYRVDDLQIIGRGSVVSDGLNYIQDVVSVATDHLSPRILRDVNRAGANASKQRP